MTAKKKPTKKAASRKAKSVGSATASAILGRPMTSKTSKSTASVSILKVKPQWSKYQKNLLGLREQLVEQMGGLAKESAEEMAGYSLHMADSGTDNFDRDFALSLLSSDQDALYEIDEALKRMEKETYGVCELTGKTIPKARLDAIPWARYTVDAQRELEREGALRQRKLGTLGTLEGNGSSEPDDDDREPATPRAQQSNKEGN